MKFNLTEEKRAEIQNYFEECMISVKEGTNQLFDTLSEIYMREQYKPLYVMTKEIADYYSEGFLEEIRQSFEDWRENGFSIHQFMLKMGAGDDDDDDAIIAARNLEDSMESIMEEALKERPDTPETSTEPNFTKELSEIFEEILDEIQRKIKEYEDSMEQCEQEVEAKCEEEAIYKAIKPIILSVQKSHATLYDRFNEGVENLKENKEDHGRMSDDYMDEAREEKVEEAENAAEEFMDVSMLWDLD